MHPSGCLFGFYASILCLGYLLSLQETLGPFARMSGAYNYGSPILCTIA